MHDARQVANFLLDYADERRIPITNMSLLKHIYFSHGWYLASFGVPLIVNRIEAWEHGPVIRCVYDCFKSFGANPITARATTINWETGEVVEAHADWPADTAALLRSILDYYSGLGAFELSELTHECGGPWDRVWNARDGKVRLNMEIPDGSIREYFLHQSKIASIQ